MYSIPYCMPCWESSSSGCLLSLSIKSLLMIYGVRLSRNAIPRWRLSWRRRHWAFPLSWRRPFTVERGTQRGMTYALLISVFIIASCGLVYELIAGTLSSYLLGDSVTQFSTVIGVYLFAMGLGSYLSRYIIK